MAVIPRQWYRNDLMLAVLGERRGEGVPDEPATG
jgi:hypothetical protein